jgi:hypothetical protein
MGEDSYYRPEHIFYDPKGIVVGTEALINYVAINNDEAGSKQIAAVVESLAQTAMQGTSS